MWMHAVGQGRWKRMFSRKPKERKVPEVNVLPTPVLVPPQEEAELGSPEVPPPPPQEAPAGEVTPPPGRELPTGEELRHAETSLGQMECHACGNDSLSCRT